MSKDKKLSLEEFQKIIKEWLKVDDKIRDTNSIIKEMKVEKKQLEEFILDYIEKTDVNMTINLSNGYMHRSVQQRKSPINKDLILKTLNTVLNDSKKAEEMTETILNNRQVKEVVAVKRVIPKNKN